MVLAASHAQALPRYGPLEVAGNISAQNLIRMSDIDQYSLVQQRNTFKLRVDYAIFEQGRFADQFDVPFIDRGKLFLLYRGVYDSIYDTTPGIPQKDIYGQNIPQRLSGFRLRPASCLWTAPVGRAGLPAPRHDETWYLNKGVSAVSPYAPGNWRDDRRQSIWPSVNLLSRGP